MTGGLCNTALGEAVSGHALSTGFTSHVCFSMLNRLQPLERHRKMPINELQPELHPSEALFDVKKLLTVGNVHGFISLFGLNYG